MKTSRIIGAILVIALFIGLLPMGVFAEDEIIKRVDLYCFALPFVGQESGKCRRLTTASGSPYEIYSQGWKNEDAGLDVSRTFESGVNYYLLVRIEPKKGYRFDHNELPMVLFDGSQDYVSSFMWVDDDGALICYSVTTKALDSVNVIGTVEIGGFTQPRVGTDPDALIDALTVPDGANYYITANCLCETDQTGAFSTFESGKEYYLFVEAVPDVRSIFWPESTPQVLLNGSTRMINTDASVVDSYYKFRCFTVKFTPLPAQTITEAAIYGYLQPKVGQTVQANLKYLRTSEDATYSLCSGARWFVETDQGDEPLEDDDVFEDGKTYYLDFSLAPHGGYRFDPSAKPTVSTNDPAYGIESTSVSSGVLRCIGESVTLSAPRVEKVKIYGFGAPIAGQTVIDNFSTLYMAIGDRYNYKAQWVRNSDGEIMGNDDVFEVGDAYACWFLVSPSYGYLFDPECEFLIGGGTEYIQNVVRHSSEKVSVITTPFLVEKPEQCIREVNLLGFSEPVVGTTAGENLALISLPENAPCSLNGATAWYCASPNTMMKAGDVFEKGKSYYLYLIVDAAEGYYFEEGTQPAAKIDGSAELIDAAYTEVKGEDRCTFYTVNLAAKTRIDEVRIVGFKEPVIGKTVSENVSSVSAYGADYRISGSVFWIRISDKSIMEDGDVFEAGESYYCRITVAPNDGCEFGGECVFLLGGSSYRIEKVTRHNSGAAILQTVPLQPVASAPIIKTADVTGYRKPVIGQTAAENLATLSVPQDAPYSISSARWYCNGSGYMSDSAAFEAGKTYYIVVVIVPEDGYRFDRDDRPMVYINGSRDDLGFTNVYADRVDVYGEDVAPAARKTGDIDGNGTVNISDVTELLYILAGAKQAELAVCDVDKDGKVNISDVTQLLRILSGN